MNGATTNGTGKGSRSNTRRFSPTWSNCALLPSRRARSDHATVLSKLQADSQAESMRSGTLVEDTKTGLAVFERQTSEKFETGQKG